MTVSLDVRRFLAWGLFALAMALTLAGLVFLVRGLSTPSPGTFGYRGATIPIPLVFAALGLMIARKYPRNAIGWLFLLNGVFAGILNFSDTYGLYGLVTNPGMPAAETVAWFQEWVWVPLFGIAASIVLLFPDGKLLSRRWLPVLGLALLFMALAAAFIALAPGPLEAFPTAVNPFGIQGAGFLDTAGDVTLLLLVLTAGAAAGSLAVRFKRAGQEERQQIKWVMAAGVLAVCTIGLGAFEQKALQAVTLLGILSVPLAIGLSILKYRLYDIDVVINRSLVYIPTTGILAGAYIAGIGVFKTLFTHVAGGGSEAAVAFTTVLVVALLTPLKNTLQAAVDKHLKETPDAARALIKLEGQIRPVVEVFDPDNIARRFLKESATALQAESGGLYLYKNGSKELAFTHGMWKERAGVSIPLEVGAREVGELRLALRKGNQSLSERKRSALQQCANTVAKALTLAGK